MAADPVRQSMSGAGFARFALARQRLNWKGAAGFGFSFWSQIVFMALNNALVLAFWGIFFARFGEVGGYGFREMALLFGVCAGAFGVANVVFGMALEVARVVHEAELDGYLQSPAPTLPHLLLSKTRVPAIGDLLFGVGMILWVAGSDWRLGLLGVALLVPAALAFAAFATLAGSLAFWFGDTRATSWQLVNLLIMVSMYPERIFGGGARVLLWILPAVLFVHWPVAALLAPGAAETAGFVLRVSLGSLALAALAAFVFARGLRRYSGASGSAPSVRMG